MLGWRIPSRSKQIKNIVRRNRHANLRRSGINHRYSIFLINRWNLLLISHKESVKEQIKDDPTFLKHRKKANSKPSNLRLNLRKQNRRWSIRINLPRSRSQQKPIHSKILRQNHAGIVWSAEVYQLGKENTEFYCFSIRYSTRKDIPNLK